MDNAFIVDHKRNEDTKDVIYYTIVGKHDELDDNKNPLVTKDPDSALAKCVVINSKTKYYVKVGAYGKIYNPIGLYSEGTANKFVAKTGRPAWQYKEVNSKIFDMYLSFLRTKNIAWLNNAEREMN
jgi:hypothetical protein